MAAPDPERARCPKCESLDVEVVIETRTGWGCQCSCCSKTFGIGKTPQEKAAWRDAQAEAR